MGKGKSNNGKNLKDQVENKNNGKTLVGDDCKAVSSNGAFGKLIKIITVSIVIAAVGILRFDLKEDILDLIYDKTGVDLEDSFHGIEKKDKIEVDKIMREYQYREVSKRYLFFSFFS